ncbi:ERF family protein [Cupriavidus sp. CV2]|uniref:ERF family protein n=1 Tax=Cupriavidus ulmosensis TaxID=3065913 RepID=UPI00296AB295|nr:ERF family protein [Cupriavidus sp. CV2]MDW3682975.1 ERF family protein [Cupriavidus sp. CV2]
MTTNQVPHVETTLTPAPAGGMGPMYTALAKAQGAFQPIEKNRSVTIEIKDKDTNKRIGSYDFRYADLQEIRAKTTPALSENGLCLFQLVTEEGGGTVIRTVLGHSTGAEITAVARLYRDDRDIKKFGAAITYLRRYIVSAMLGVAADDDLDEDRDPDAGTDKLPAAEEHAGMCDAKTIGELSKIMSGLPKEERARYNDYYGQRQQELRAATQEAA